MAVVQVGIRARAAAAGLVEAAAAGLVGSWLTMAAAVHEHLDGQETEQVGVRWGSLAHFSSLSKTIDL